MSDEAEHLGRADAALDAAKALRTDHPAWALVPLFYSAMHVMHACFDRDQLAPEERHPDQHKSYWTGGVRSAWGTLDVVRRRYPQAVSRVYSSLYDAGYATRYKSPPRGDGGRFWTEYEQLRRLVGF